MTSKKYICNACDLLLRNQQFPVNILQNSLTCFFCDELLSKIFYMYDQNIYDNNAFSKQLQRNNMTIDEGSIICEKYHKLLMNKCDVKCSLFGNMNQRKYTYVCDRRKYKKFINKKEILKQVLEDKGKKHYICKSCHTNIQQELQCV